MGRRLNPLKSLVESRRERRLKGEVEGLISRLAEESSRLKVCASLIERLRRELGGELDRLVGPPPSIPSSLLSPSAVIVSPEDKEVRLGVEEVRRELSGGFQRVSGEKLKAAINGAVAATRGAEDACLKYIESTIEALLAKLEALIRPFSYDARFKELLAAVEGARSKLRGHEAIDSLRSALDDALSLRGRLEELRPEALRLLRETASALIREAELASEEALKAGARPVDVEEALKLARSVGELPPDVGWEELSYYEGELEEALRRLREFRESVCRLEELREVDEAVDYVTSKLPELRGEVVEARRALKDLIEEGLRGRLIEEGEADSAVSRVEEALMRAGAGKVLREVNELYRELKRRLGANCEVEEPPRDLKGEDVIERMEEVAKCKEKMERLVKSMVEVPKRVASVEELVEALKGSRGEGEA